MTVKRKAALAAVAIAVAGCAAMGSQAPSRDRDAALDLMKKDFTPRGQATLDRLDQDETQKICTQYAQGEVPEDVAKRIESSQLALVRYPADGHYVGDWKAGEKVAQAGVGKQWSDDPKNPAGGNCYACHQLSKAELSFGTIGPSLYNFGKTRGYGVEMQKYAYAKVYNPEAYSACSSMPRFGHNGVLTEQQIKDVVALLMDPASPVNQ
ncbi:MAG: sulfur oxidation c-type cytochrome SoxX [Usitatibacter sp.]